MVALDTSAIVSIVRGEPDASAFVDAIVTSRAVIGSPTALETAMVLSGKIPGFAEAFLDEFLAMRSVQVVDFSAEMYRVSADAFRRFGKGRRHPAQLNFGDCMSYAVAKTLRLPLLFKGDDFIHTDIEPALAA